MLTYILTYILSTLCILFLGVCAEVYQMCYCCSDYRRNGEERDGDSYQGGGEKGIYVQRQGGEGTEA